MNDMRAQIVDLGELLNLERKANEDLSAELARISDSLADATRERDALEAQLADTSTTLSIRESEIERLTACSRKRRRRWKRRAPLEQRVAALESTEAALNDSQRRIEELEMTLEERVAALETSRAALANSEAERTAAQTELAALSARNAASLQRVDELEEKNAASQAEIVRMTNAITALRLRIEELTTLLADKEAQAARDKIAIASLGKSLNNALASRVQELQRFRSEFFGRLRDVLRGRDDVRIVGDRFVFQSEVLFGQGQANIAAEGEMQLAQLAVALTQIAAEIPEDIDWVLQVEGHTDDIPVRAGRFADNWDLSTERALSVVRFLAEQGLPPNRLAAAGYGEFQPLDPADSDEARRRNRRIEMKLTQRISAN